MFYCIDHDAEVVTTVACPSGDRSIVNYWSARGEWAGHLGHDNRLINLPIIVV